MKDEYTVNAAATKRRMHRELFALNEIIVRIFKASKMRSIACVIFAQIKKKRRTFEILIIYFAAQEGIKLGARKRQPNKIR